MKPKYHPFMAKNANWTTPGKRQIDRNYTTGSGAFGIVPVQTEMERLLH